MLYKSFVLQKRAVYEEHDLLYHFLIYVRFEMISGISIRWDHFEIYNHNIVDFLLHINTYNIINNYIINSRKNNNPNLWYRSQNG